MADKYDTWGDSENWHLMKWLWDALEDCPVVDNVDDVDAGAGTLGLVSKSGDAYTITIKKNNWRNV